MMEFKSFRSAAATIAGIELMHMIRKGQLQMTGELRPAQQFYSLQQRGFGRRLQRFDAIMGSK
jgi:hypothetical protein